MTWSLHHEWRSGAHLPGGRLATCTKCGVVRHEQPSGTRVYVRPRTHGQMPESDRVSERDPPCLSKPDVKARKMDITKTAAWREATKTWAAEDEDAAFDDEPATVTT